MTLDTKEKDILAYTIVVLSNSLSILACILIILIYYKAKDLRVYAFKLVVYLAILDLIKSASMLIPTYSATRHDFSCILQATVYQFFTIAGFLLTLLMAISLYSCIIQNCQDIEKYHKVFIILIFLASFSSTLPILIFQVWGRVNYWCWVSDQNTLLRFSTFYGPLWLENCVNLYLYYKVIKKLKKEDLEIYRLRFYPLILIGCYLPATLARLLEACHIPAPYFLVLVTGFCDGILGLVNFTCYGFTKHVKSYVRHLLFFNKTQSRLGELQEVNVLIK